MKKIFTTILVLTMVASLLTGCETTAVDAEAEYTEQLMIQMATEIGNPNITEFYEKKLAKEIFEKRDDSDLICYVYTVDINGWYNYMGRSMGYGLPFSTQYTAPTVDNYIGSGGTETICQADPNGLYTADGLSATWLMMIDEESGETYIEYNEAPVIVTEHKKPICNLSQESIDRIEKFGIDY